MKFNKLAVVISIGMTVLLSVSFAKADSVKIDFLGGFTGSIESLTPPIQKGADLAISEVNAAGGVNGSSIEIVAGDTTCVDATEAANAADRLVNLAQSLAPCAQERPFQLRIMLLSQQES